MYLLAVLISTLGAQCVRATTSYCDNDFCAATLYCCGTNECCSYVWTLWYIWLAFGTGIFIGLFLLWKYYFYQQRRKNKSFNSFSKPYANSSSHESSGDRMLTIKNSSFAYKPLNDDTFVEQQIDDQVIQFNLVKPMQKTFTLNEEQSKHDLRAFRFSQQ